MSKMGPFADFGDRPLEERRNALAPALKIRPEIAQCSAWGKPTSFGRNQALPASGARPGRAKIKPILVPWATMRISIGSHGDTASPTCLGVTFDHLSTSSSFAEW
jgi:hypothetical protein